MNDKNVCKIEDYYIDAKTANQQESPKIIDFNNSQDKRIL
jgi:hypothetical protein